MKFILSLLFLLMFTATTYAAPLNQWTYVPVAGTSCGDPGTTAGFSVYPTTDRRLLIYMQGGGYCYDYNTCFNMRVGSAAPGFLQLVSNLQGTKQTNPPANVTVTRSNNAADGNPFAGWSKVFIGYCTGDLGMGSNTATYSDPLGGKHTIHHTGYSNVTKFLPRLTALFSPSQVVVVGTSAGGFAAAWNTEQIQEAFHLQDERMEAIDDAGPLMREPYWTSTLEGKMAASWWGIGANSIPGACSAEARNCDPRVGGQFNNLISDLGAIYANLRVALITSMADNSISWAFSRLTFAAPDNATPFAVGPCGSATAGDCLPDGYPGLQVQPGYKLHGYFCSQMLPNYVASQPREFKTFAVTTRQTTTVGALSPNTHGLLVTWPLNQVRAGDGTTLAAFLSAELGEDGAWSNHAFTVAQAPTACAGWSF